MGQPPCGFPEDLQKVVLKGEKPLTDRPGALLPPCDFDKAKRAVIACAYRAKLSPEKAKEFWHYNAVRRWTAIDCGSTIAELAHAFMERWFKEDRDAYWKEQDRRKRAAANRVLT